MMQHLNIEIRQGHGGTHLHYYPVLIIGAGAAGLLLGCRLKEKYGFNQFRIFERQSGIGGVWYINRYPGVACDVPSAFYSYSFAPNKTSQRLYPTGQEFVQYLNGVATNYGIVDKVQLNTDVMESIWIEEDLEWEVTLTHLVPRMGDKSVKDRKKHAATFGQGSVTLSTTKVRAKVVFSSVGFLAEPNAWPSAIPGENIFGGDLFHSARWRNDVKFNDKNIVVVGAGSSSVQIVPNLFKEPYHVKSITQLVRTAPWVIPRVKEPFGKDIYKRYAPRINDWAPFLGHLMRFCMFLKSELDWFTIFQATNQGQREKVECETLEQMRDTIPKEYHDIMTPDYAIGCKRRISDKEWMECMSRPDFTLTNQPLLRLESDGVILGPEETELEDSSIEVQEGEMKVPADVIVLSNGFEGTRWLHPMHIVGRYGKALHDVWDERGGPQAYMGTAVDGFPNFFMVTGPNSSSSHSSYITNAENLANLALKIIDPVLKGEALTAEVTREATKHWAEQLKEDFKKTTLSDCTSWYQDENGVNTVIYPRSQTEQTLRCMFPDYGAWKFTYTGAGERNLQIRVFKRYGLLVLALVTVFIMLDFEGINLAC